MHETQDMRIIWRGQRPIRFINRLFTPLIYAYGSVAFALAAIVIVQPADHAQWQHDVMTSLQEIRGAKGSWMLDHPDAATRPLIEAYNEVRHFLMIIGGAALLFGLLSALDGEDVLDALRPRFGWKLKQR